jgi:hypothetical protein
MTHPRLLDVRLLLQKALELELFTIPPYLCALYSIPTGKNRESAEILQGVLMEEMLHMALVANVLNAIGGAPQISPRLACNAASGWSLQVRTYPSRPPHVELPLEVPLRRFCPASIETFRAIEAPDPPESWQAGPLPSGLFANIGHFYDVVLNRLVALSTEIGEEKVFCGDRSRQLQRLHYYGGGGNIVPVHCLAGAKDVIAEVAQQGEGRRTSNVTGDEERFGQPKEVAHYFRFQQILARRYYDRDADVDLSPDGPELAVDWSAVYPMGDNPNPAVAQPEGVRDLLASFNETYCELLDGLHCAFNGEPVDMQQAIPRMHGLRHQAVSLMNVPTGDDVTLGPPLWFVEMIPSGRGAP